MSKNKSRLGALLADPAPPADEDSSYAAHQAKKTTPAPAARPWVATDTKTYDEIARVDAPDQATAITLVQEQTGRRGDFAVSEVDPDTGQPALRPPRASGRLAERGAPVVLPRERKKRVPKDKLTVQIPASLIDGLRDLVERDGTRRYDEVEEALRAHLRRKGIKIEED